MIIYLYVTGSLRMITRITFDRAGNFNLFGTIKNSYIDFERHTMDERKFLKQLVKLSIDIKKIIYRMLADDDKIIGKERIVIVKEIDELLLALFEYGIFNSSDPYTYYVFMEKVFSLQLSLSRSNNLKGNGSLYKLSSTDISDFGPWLNLKIFEPLKRVIKSNKNKELLKEEMEHLVFHCLALRYKIEYI